MLVTEQVRRTEGVGLLGRSFGATSRLVTTRGEKRDSAILQSFDRLTVPALFELPCDLINHVLFTDSTIHVGDAGMSL